MIEEAGYHVLFSFGTGGIPLPFLRRILPLFAQQLLDNAGVRFCRGLFSTQMIFVASTA